VVGGVVPVAALDRRQGNVDGHGRRVAGVDGAAGGGDRGRDAGRDGGAGGAVGEVRADAQMLAAPWNFVQLWIMGPQ